MSGIRSHSYAEYLAQQPACQSIYEFQHQEADEWYQVSQLRRIFSLVLPFGFPLLHKCRHSLLPVLGGEGGLEEPLLKAHPLPQRQLKGSVGGLLADLHRDLRVAGDGVGSLHGFSHKILRWENLEAHVSDQWIDRFL